MANTRRDSSTYETLPSDERSEEEQSTPKEDSDSYHFDLPELGLGVVLHGSVDETHERPRKDED